ncbi:endo alpha-1,4 polygalactosaminidase [bacterium]|nr:endo alpha-1,4 polygalactosaminidase [bacterium]
MKRFHITSQILFLLAVLALILTATPVKATWPPQGWVYQLQNVSIPELSDVSPDVVVIDYSTDGDENGEWDSDQIQALKDAGITVLAYFSIGEAEDYRFYWQDGWTPGSPEWLGPVNPDWAGNYKVRYWMQGWRDILFGTATGDNESYLDRICDQGFDGIYMDIIDAYYYWSEVVPENEDAAGDMIALISNLATYARDTRGMGEDFKIIPQNGEWLRYDASEVDVDSYYSVVDGIGVEDVFYFGDLDNDNPYNPRSEEIDIIDEMIERDKVVLSVEYLTNTTTIENYYDLAQGHGWTPIATTRELDQLIYYPDLLTVNERTTTPLPTTIGINAWPNPFNASTRVSVDLPSAGYTEIRLFNMLGKQVMLLYAGQSSGSMTIALQPDGLASGNYMVQIRQNGNQATRRVTLLK